MLLDPKSLKTQDGSAQFLTPSEGPLHAELAVNILHLYQPIGTATLEFLAED